MTDSDPQLIRHATIDDLDALAAMESECFPAAEAAEPLVPARPNRDLSGMFLAID